MRPDTFWEKVRKHVIWGEWSMFTSPGLIKDGRDRIFVVGKLKIIWKASK
jgi:hypothetical protein